MRYVHFVVGLSLLVLLLWPWAVGIVDLNWFMATGQQLRCD